jgi:hypothetical protein
MLTYVSKQCPFEHVTVFPSGVNATKFGSVASNVPFSENFAEGNKNGLIHNSVGVTDATFLKRK